MSNFVEHISSTRLRVGILGNKKENNMEDILVIPCFAGIVALLVMVYANLFFGVNLISWL